MPMHKEYRREWVKAGYGSVMGSAEVVLPPPPEFIRVYHLTSSDHAIDNIERGRIKVARFRDLNDPFELLALSLAERSIRTVVKDFRVSFDGNTGLLCFSANWTNPVLWSHYGDKHRGICLGFNVRRTIVEKVDYADTRLRRLSDDSDPNHLSDAQQRLLRRTKYKHWIYESEHRVFVTLSDAVLERGLHFRPFDADIVLKEVILGPQCTASFDAVRRLTTSHYAGAVTFQSRLAYKFFAVVPNEKTVP